MAHGDFVGSAVGFELCATGKEQGANNISPSHRDSRQATDTCPPKDPHQHGLGLVISVVRGGDHSGTELLGRVLEEAIARLAGIGLIGIGKCAQLDDAGQATVGGESGAEPRIAIGVLATHPMMEVGHSRGLRQEPQCGGLTEQEEQGAGVGAAGERNEGALPRKQQSPLRDKICQGAGECVVVRAWR
jgi:hypothetical protein